MKLPLVSIVIPTHNRNKQLSTLLQSIYESSYQNYEIIVVNDSTLTLPFRKRENLTIIQNQKSFGLAYSRNRGANLAHGEYVVFIDDDNILHPEMIQNLISLMQQDKTITAAGPITYYASDKNQMWFAGAYYNLYTTIPRFVPEAQAQSAPTIDVDIIHNCFVVRKAAGEAEIWFDEFVNMGGTELDLFMRIRKRNPRARFVIASNAICYHAIDLPINNSFRNLGFTKEKRAFYFQRNRAIIVKRYGKIVHLLILVFITYPLFLLAYTVLFLYHKKYTFIIAQAQGVLAGYRYVFSKSSQ